MTEQVKKKRGNPTGKGGFQKGKSGNPNGVPKKSLEFKKLCAERSEEALDKITKIMRTGSDRDAYKAAELILHYAHGKPSQNLEVSGVAGKDLIPAEVVSMPPAASREEWIRNYNAAMIVSMSQ